MEAAYVSTFRRHLRQMIDQALTEGTPVVISDLHRRVGLAADGLMAALHNLLPPHPAPACGPGCVHCCHQYGIAVAPLEALALGHHILHHFTPGDRQALRARLLERERERVSHPLGALVLPRFPCPLLREDSCCSVYAVRPIVCRGVNALSAAACERARRMTQSVAIVRRWRPPMDIAAAAAQAMGESCQSAGLVAHSLLLTPALMLVLDDPDLERDWLAGKDVFAAVRLRDLAPALWDYGASAP